MKMSPSVVNPSRALLTFFSCRACLQALKASVVDDAVSFCAVLQNRQKGEEGWGACSVVRGGVRAGAGKKNS